MWVTIAELAVFVIGVRALLHFRPWRWVINKWLRK